MEYRELKRQLGEKSADDLENAVLVAFAQAQTPEAREALTRMLAFLTATVANRIDAPDIADRCVSDFVGAYRVLRRDDHPLS